MWKYPFFHIETNHDAEQANGWGTIVDKPTKKWLGRDPEIGQRNHSREQSQAQWLDQTILRKNVTQPNIHSKNYLIAQKAEYMRFGNQINTMIQNSKEINQQLSLLANKFDEFQKNVGIWSSIHPFLLRIHLSIITEQPSLKLPSPIQMFSPRGIHSFSAWRNFCWIWPVWPI